MKTVIKATIAAAIIAMSYNASAKDGAFTGNVQFQQAAASSMNVAHYQKQGTAERSHNQHHNLLLLKSYCLLLINKPLSTVNNTPISIITDT
ncbi:hypothetical protein [Photobacterium sp. GB-1]|uniref:hypothetical protein n=1 Tax=Photobacterium sp. GB-1 TaxID=2022111 RepID=UPI001E3A9E58|nr:hypothetical protein [Photobacterium sp. GB-1]